MEKFLLAVLALGVTVGIFGLWAGITAVSALFLAWAWNLAVPMFWAAAPHLTFWPSFAIVILLGFVSGVFNRTTTVTTKG